jgi:hypothetical protein
MKIKFLLTLLFVVGLGFTSMAQSISVGPRVGFTSSKIVGDLTTNAVEGLQVGAVLNYGINDMLSVQPELLLVQKGGSFFGNSMKMNFLEVPVLAKASFELGEFTGFATGGPTFGYLMNGSFKDREGSEDMEFEDGDKRLELGASLGVGLGYNVGPGTLNLDVRYGLGLSSLNKEENVKNRVFGISLAYLFSL